MPHDLDGLRAKLAVLDARAAAVEAEAKPHREAFSAKDKPFRDREKAIEAEREAVLAEHGTHEIDRCEGCSKLIFEGERFHVCRDGEYVCVDCAPTWNDLRADLMDEGGEWAVSDDPSGWINRAEAMIAADKGDEKVC